jgi:hypothetical protein
MMMPLSTNIGKGQIMQQEVGYLCHGRSRNRGLYNIFVTLLHFEIQNF